MAKKTATGSFADSVWAEVNRQFGEVIHGGDEVLKENRMVIPFSPALDPCLGGGIPEGTWTTISGKYGTGKTSAALRFAANAQRPENGSRDVYLISIEGRYGTASATGTDGLITTPPRFNVVESQKDQILSAQDFLRISSIILNQHPGCVLILDSPSMMAPEESRAEGVEYQNRGQVNKILSEFVRQNSQVVRVQKSFVISCIHLKRSQGFMAGWDEQIAETFNYASSSKLRIKFDKPWKTGPAGKEHQIGQILKWEVDKTSLRGPGASADGYLRYGIGIDCVMEKLIMAIDLGLVSKSGSWYSLDFMGDKAQKAQGLEPLWELLRGDSNLYDQLSSKLNELTGGA